MATPAYTNLQRGLGLCGFLSSNKIKTNKKNKIEECFITADLSTTKTLSKSICPPTKRPASFAPSPPRQLTLSQDTSTPPPSCRMKHSSTTTVPSDITARQLLHYAICLRHHCTTPADCDLLTERQEMLSPKRQAIPLQVQRSRLSSFAISFCLFPGKFKLNQLL